MGTAKWDKVIKYLNSKPKASPDKVLNMLKTIYGTTDKQESQYQILRGSWAIDVVCQIYNKNGTTNKNKKLPIRQIIRNWCNTENYARFYLMFHPGKMYKDIPLEKHVRNCNEIWLDKRYNPIKRILKSNNGKLPAFFPGSPEYNTVMIKK